LARTCKKAVLRRDLVTSEGRRLAARGELVDLTTLRTFVARREVQPELRLFRTFVAAAVLEGLDAPPLRHLVGSDAARSEVAEVLADVRFPTAVWRELELTQLQDPARFQHGIWSAIVSARLFSVALGTTVGAARAVASRAEDFDVVDRELVVPGLDPRHDGLKVAQISDVHLGASTPDARVERAVRTINALNPDLVFLTGDYVTFSRHPLKRLSRQLSGITAPTYAVLGNHDHWIDGPAVRQAPEADGYPVLQNAAVARSFHGAPLWIVGVDDAQTGHADVARAFRDVPAHGTKLVLAHQPRSADQLPANASLVCFAGHTHGGQIDVPGITSLVARSIGQPYLRGAYRVRGNWLFVNAGLGYGKGGAALRLRVPPEIAIITLRAG